MDNYKQAVVEQFLKHTQEDWRSFDYTLKDENVKKELYLWLKRRVEISRRYILFLKELGIDLNNRNIVELGKGKYDSMVYDGINTGIINKTNVKIVTPYADSFDTNNPNIINSEFYIKDNEVLLVEEEYSNILIPTNPSFSNTYITHNPYSLVDLADFRNIHNQTRDSIIIGIYGSNDDLYKDLGHFVLDSILSSKLVGDYIDISKEGNDNESGYYLRFVASIKNKDKINKIRTRF